MPRKVKLRFNPDIIETVQKFKKRFPYTGSYKEKLEKFNAFLNALSGYYRVRTPGLYVIEDYMNATPFDDMIIKSKGVYLPYQEIIALRNFSIISLLHEFRHHLQDTGNILLLTKNTEDDANAWSHHLFKLVWTKSYEKLSKEGKLNRTMVLID